MFFNGVTVAVTPPAQEDRNGDPISTPVPYPVANVGVAWDSTSEDNDRRTSAISEIRLLFPPGTVPELNSMITLPDGDNYRMVGKPSVPRSPFTGWQPGVTIRAKAVVS